jgi:hypothetical protein
VAAANIAALEKANIDYILGVREHFAPDDGVTIPFVIKRQRGETQLEIKDVTLRGRRCAVMRKRPKRMPREEPCCLRVWSAS